ncbi:hypothetical protein FHS78_001319 [Parvibaculum indicum]|uniref:hypothetical protein n=1 Tax=Parvibaculum indicum TaxID=562969 RepID=UPI0014232393|nr:hypothetical protein [Parvibaculum indicum]NIJ41038.1 hypothetical protein [Parvibaculum indicum]
MRLIFSAAIALLMLTGGAYAADAFASFYGNTVKITGEAGKRTVMINEDGTYSSTLPDGSTITGTWTNKDGTACFNQDGSDAEPYCVAAEPREVGETWELTAPDGTKEKATLVAGN